MMFYSTLSTKAKTQHLKQQHKIQKETIDIFKQWHLRRKQESGDQLINTPLLIDINQIVHPFYSGRGEREILSLR